MYRKRFYLPKSEIWHIFIYATLAVFLYSPLDSYAQKLPSDEEIAEEEGEEPTDIDWTDWSDTAFQNAKDQDKLVVLVLGEDWSESTERLRTEVFAKPEVIRLINDYYIPIWVDAENELLLKHIFTRSDDIIPKIVILTPEQEVVSSLSGFLPATRIRTFLYDVLKKDSRELLDLSTNLTHVDKTSFSSQQQSQLLEYFSSQVDWDQGGYRKEMRSLPEPLMFFLLSQQSNKRYDALAQTTLTANFDLFDPIWGGVYKSSQYGVWQKPVFGKSSLDQAKNILLYSLAFMKYGNPKFKSAALSVVGYLDKWMAR